MRLRSALLLTASLGGLGVCNAELSHTLSTYNPAPIMSLCFSEAFRAKSENRISEQEYVRHLTAHLRGVRHQGDELDNQSAGKQVHKRSRFTAVFRVFALSHRTLSTEDAAIYDQLLLRCSAGDFDATKSTFARLESDPSLQIPLQALAILAARQGHADILDFCLQKGAKLDEDVDISAGQAVDSAEMIELLWNRNWRDIQHSERMQQGMIIRSIGRPLGMLKFLIGHGVKIPSLVFELPSLGQVSLPMMKILVRECGVDQFRGTAALTFAVKEGNRDVVEYLCQIGLSVNEVPPELDPREPSMCSPLYAAVEKRDISMMELLLEHGADPHAPFAEGWPNSVLYEVQQRDDKELLSVLEKYAATKPSGQNL